MIEPVTAVVLTIVLLFVLMAIGLPVFAALGVSGLFGVVSTEGFGYVYSTLRTLVYQETVAYLLVVVPMFILLGNFAYHAGVGRALFGISRRWVGHWPGGLAMSSVLTCAGFSAASGSSVATAATVGSIALPEMKKAGYDNRLSTGAIAAGGVLGVLIPPSVLLVFYAAINQVSAGAMLLAGVIPGIVSTAVFLGGIWVVTRINPHLARPAERAGWRARFVSLLGALAAGRAYRNRTRRHLQRHLHPYRGRRRGRGGRTAPILLISPTRGKLRGIWSSCQDAITTTVMIMMTIVGAAIFSLFLSLVQLPQMLSEFVATLPLPGAVIVLPVPADLLPPRDVSRRLFDASDHHADHVPGGHRSGLRSHLVRHPGGKDVRDRAHYSTSGPELLRHSGAGRGGEVRKRIPWFGLVRTHGANDARHSVRLPGARNLAADNHVTRDRSLATRAQAGPARGPAQPRQCDCRPQACGTGS
ncbi:MAG: TRAP transporter large permease subunit [Arhodomonas sp.]|nr:TRAP transporter large permease subunit [Arhodomonas sp.]